MGWGEARVVDAREAMDYTLAMIDGATTLVDEWLGVMGTREVFTADEVRDRLLDLRQVLTT